MNRIQNAQHLFLMVSGQGKCVRQAFYWMFRKNQGRSQLSALQAWQLLFLPQFSILSFFKWFKFRPSPLKITFRVYESCQYNPFKLPKIQMQELTNPASRSNGRWTHEEHILFLEGLRLYGKNWKKIEQLLKTRTGSQIRSHAQKFFLKTKTSTSADGNALPSTQELQDEHEEATLNSKSASESPSENEDSYFLSKIIEYSSSRQCLDFWEGLVDCKDERISKCPHVNRSSSFISYEQPSTEKTHGCRTTHVFA